MSDPVPKSYLCQTSFIPIYMKTMSGFKSRTSVLYLTIRSEILFPLIPFPINSKSDWLKLFFNKLMKPISRSAPC